MTLREEVLQLFDAAAARIEGRSTRPGVLPRAGDPDPRWVTVNETNEAISASLLLLADRIDALEAEANTQL